MFQLCHNFSVKVFQSDLSRLKKDLDRLNLVLNYISENYKRPISLDEIAGVAYLQTGYFCRFFKKKMGVTFLEYQNEYRLSFIYKDLINTKDHVHVILERHGFNNYKLFRRMFQEHFGCTPTKVRENMRITVPSLTPASLPANTKESTAAITDMDTSKQILVVPKFVFYVRITI